MENANDFERFVLYRTEEALQMDSRGLEWNIQEKSELLQNQYINEILYRALNSTQPWNDFSFIDASGIKEFFYSNALACALVTFGYLSSENTTLEEIMCDPKKHEVAEKNKAIKEDAEEFRKKCQKLYEKRKVWQEEFKEKHNIKEWYIEIKEMEEKIKIEEKAVKTETDKKKIKADNNKLDEMKSYAEAIERKLANYAEIIKCPYTYIPLKGKIKNFLAPLTRKIVYEVAEKKYAEIFDYKMIRLHELYTSYLDGRRPLRDRDEWLDDEGEDDVQRQRKSQLIKLYSDFCNELVRIGNERDGYETCSEYVMNEFAKELIYHSRAIIEFENFVGLIKAIPYRGNANLRDVLENEFYRRENIMRFKCSAPVLFYSDEMIYEKSNICMPEYIAFLKRTVVEIYVLAGKKTDNAYSLVENYVNKKGAEYFKLENLKLWDSPSDQKDCRISSIESVLYAISPRAIYTEGEDLLKKCALLL